MMTSKTLKVPELYVIYNKTYNCPYLHDEYFEDNIYVGAYVSYNEELLNEYITFYNKWCDFYTNMLKNEYTRAGIDNLTIVFEDVNYQNLHVVKKYLTDVIKDIHREIMEDKKISLVDTEGIQEKVGYGSYIFYMNPHVSKRELTIDNYEDALMTFISSDKDIFYKDPNIRNTMRTMRKKKDKKELARKFKTK